jgi:hypothetical protein
MAGALYRPVIARVIARAMAGGAGIRGIIARVEAFRQVPVIARVIARARALGGEELAIIARVIARAKPSRPMIPGPNQTASIPIIFRHPAVNSGKYPDFWG